MEIVQNNQVIKRTQYVEKMLNEVEKVKIKVETCKEWLNWLQEDITSYNDRIDELSQEIEEGNHFFQYLDSDELLKSKLEEFPLMNLAIHSDATKSVNKKNLEELIEEKKKEIQQARGRVQKREDRKLYYMNAMQDLEKLLLKNSQMLQESQKMLERCKAQADEAESGLLYIHGSQWIRTVSSRWNNLGLVARSSNMCPFMGRYTTTAAACKELEDAWRLLGLDSATMPPGGGMPTAGDKILEDLIMAVPFLDKKSLTNAWRACQFEFQINHGLGEGMVEMELFQLVYLPFSLLFLAATCGVHKLKYMADQDVHTSLSVRCKWGKQLDDDSDVDDDDNVEEDEFQMSKVCTKADVSVTMHDDGWDAVGMMTINAMDKTYNHEYLYDNDKCGLMTAVTAVILSRCIPPSRYGEVALPFLIATSYRCTLYVTTLDGNGMPQIQVVGYPNGGDDGTALKQLFNQSPSMERTKMFVALAVLLNKVLKLFDADTRAAYKALFAKNWEAMIFLPTFVLSAERMIPKVVKISEECLAREAAACGGRFCNVRYPFIRSLTFAKKGSVVDEQEESPFYFKGNSTTEGGIALTDKEVFLKVWKVSDTNVPDVEWEGKCHRLAFEAGVPVAPPVLTKIVRAQSSKDGSEYLVFATEYIVKDSFQKKSKMVQFCCSLMDAVEKLHTKAGLLHGDLKPGNILWKDGVVYLIDFGHAQKISEACWSPGTEGFEAPEIRTKKLPCSTQTDAYSVGKTIFALFPDLENKERFEGTCEEIETLNIVHNVCTKLTDPDPESRWSLARASKELEPLLVVPKMEDEDDDSFDEAKVGQSHDLKERSSTSSPPTKLSKLSSH